MTREQLFTMPVGGESEEKELEEQAPDPTTFSEVGELNSKGDGGGKAVKGGTFAGEVKQFENRDGGDAGFIEVDGVQFWEIGKNVREQQLVSLMLKGIVNVADVVAYEGKAYSKEMPVDDIVELATEADRRADIELLNLVFGDGDHETISQQRDNGFNNHSTNHNIIEGKSNDKCVLFDFDQVNILDIEEMSEIAQVAQSVADLDVVKVSVTRLHNKVEKLNKRFVGSEGLEFLKAIMQKIAQEFGDDKFDEYEGLNFKLTKSKFDQKVFDCETKEVNSQFVQKLHEVVVHRLEALELFLQMRLEVGGDQLDMEKSFDLADEMVAKFAQKYSDSNQNAA